MLDKMLKMQQPSADMAGAHAIGPKKIHVFPKKKKFPDKPRSPGFGPAITHDQGIQNQSHKNYQKTTTTRTSAQKQQANGSSRNDEMAKLAKYKSLEAFPIQEILQELSKQTIGNTKKVLKQPQAKRPSSGGSQARRKSASGPSVPAQPAALKRAHSPPLAQMTQLAPYPTAKQQNLLDTFSSAKQPGHHQAANMNKP